MASSGWQGARQITNWASMDLRVDAISHSGDTMYLTATLRVTCTAYYMYDQTNTAYLGVTGGGTQGITYDLTPYSNPPYVERTFNCTISSPSSATTAVVTGEFSGSGVYRAESWTLYFDPAGTAPTDLTATLVDFGPDWAQIAVSISSYGTPSTSANRYIEAGVCQGPNYGGPYKYAIATAVTSNTFTISNTSPGGTMTIAPNTSYIYGGYATNNTVDVATVGGTFVTLPSAPVLSAADMGGGQIEVDVAHAAEGSAYQVTEEYSVDGGTTWNQILNNKFSLLLNAQTVVTVRRVSAAGASTSTITIAPQFNVAVYASVLNKSKLITKVYAPKASSDRQMVSISSVTDSEYATVPEENYATLKAMIMANNVAKQTIVANPQWGYCDISLYHKSAGSPMYALYFHLRPNSTPGSSPNDFALLASVLPTGSFSDFVSRCADYGVVVDSSYENAPTDVDVYLPIDATFGYPDVSKKVAKIYASVAGKTKLVFEDI